MFVFDSTEVEVDVKPTGGRSGYWIAIGQFFGQFIWKILVHLPGGVPQKGIYKESKDCFPNCSLNFRVLKLRFLVFSGCPGGFREVRGAGRNHLHLSWYLMVPGIRSYSQKSWEVFLPSTVSVLLTQ